MTDALDDLISGTALPPSGLHKYARVEVERRFLFAAPPAPSTAIATRRITDRYVDGTRLRLRLVEDVATGEVVRKLTQKEPSDRLGPVQGLITTIYVSAEEYAVLATLAAATLSKARLSVPPLGIDIFEGPLQGLVLGEAEFATVNHALAFPLPPGCVAEVTDDERFTGGRLARATTSDVTQWLAEYGLA